MLAIWSLVPLPFLNPAWTSGNSQFTYCWSLAWRILSINWLACEMSANMHLSVVRGATECCPILLCIHQCCYSVTKLCDSKESPHRIHYARFPCPSPSPGVCSNSCPLSRWCHPIISSFVIPFSSCLHSFPASGSFPVSWFFTSGGQSIGASATASVLSVNIHSGFPLGLTSLISFLSKGCSSLLQDHSSKASVLRYSAFFMVQFSHPHITTEKP